MTKAHLRACATCARHVRVTETSCPFCGFALRPEHRGAPAPQPPRASLTRAALFAFGTGTLAFAPGCSSSSSPVQEPDASQVQDAAYGGPPIETDASPIIDAARTAEPPIEFAGGVAPVYGAPATDSGQGIAAYGGPPVDSGADGSSH